MDGELVDPGYPGIVEYPAGNIFGTAHAPVIAHIAHFDTHMAGINALHIYGVNGNQYNGYDEGGYGPDHPGQPEPAFFGYIIFLPECAYDQGYDEKDKEEKDGGDHVGRFWVRCFWLRVMGYVLWIRRLKIANPAARQRGVDKK